MLYLNKDTLNIIFYLKHFSMQEIEVQNAPVIKTTDWLITILLVSIPVVNIIMLIVWAFSDSTNPNKSNFSKAALIWMVIWIVLYFLFIVLFGAAMFSGMSQME